jgi:hypothetical protein
MGWGAWLNRGTTLDPSSIGIDIWPDTSELGADELCTTPFRLPSGSLAYLFSDWNSKTVARHFQWMRQYGINGAAMQRFIGDISKGTPLRFFDRVLQNARAGAEANGRGIFVMYDVTGMNGPNTLSMIERDWPHLAGELRVTGSSSYIYDHGKPVVGIWGIGFKSRPIDQKLPRPLSILRQDLFR